MPIDRPITSVTPWRRSEILDGKIRYGETVQFSTAGPSRYTEFVSPTHGCSRMHGHVSEKAFALVLDRMRRLAQ